MSMYKTIFVTENENPDAAGEKIFTINGEVSLYGDSAFASLNEAVAAIAKVDGNAIVVKVASGKYDSYVVVANGVAGAEAAQVVAVDFNGGTFTYDNGEYTRDVEMTASGFTAAEQDEIVAALNENGVNEGVFYVAGTVAGDAVSTIHIGSTTAFADLGNFSGISETVDAGNLIKNDEAFVIVDGNTSIGDVIGSIEHETGHLMGEKHEVTDGTINDFTAVSTAYISKDYNSTTEGWGVSHFNNWAAARSATTTSATITIAENSGHVGYLNTNDYSRSFTIGAGSTVGVQLKLYKVKGTVTVKAGASFNVAPHAGIPTPYTHIDGGKLYVGEANSTARATMNFDNNSVSTLWSATFETHNADITIGDFGSVGKTSFYDSTIEVKGSLCFGSNGKDSLNQNQGSANSNIMSNSTMTVKGHDIRNEIDYYANDYNRIAGLTMDKSTIIVNDGVEGTTADRVELGNTKGKKTLILNNGSKIEIEKGTAVSAIWDVTVNDSTIEAGDLSIVDGAFTVKGKSTIDIADLTIAEGKTLKLDSSSILKLDSLSGDGKIQITLLEGFEESSTPIIDFNGNNADEGILGKIELIGGEGYVVEIKEGDIFVAEKSVPAEIVESDDKTKTSVTLGSDKSVLSTDINDANKNVEISTGDENTTVTDAAKITSDIGGKVVTLTNNKQLKVTGSITAAEDVIITNSGTNKVDDEGNLVSEATLNAGMTKDENGKLVEQAVQIKATNGSIIMTNDGHANVALDAKNIVIANNSVNTLTGAIGKADTVSVEIATGTATADGEIVSGSGDVDGAIKNATITAKNISIADQTVTDTAFETPELNVYGDTNLGAGNTYSGNIFFGSKDQSVNATIDMTDVTGGNIVAGNGSVTLSGEMDASIQGPQLDIGGFLNPGGVGPKDAEMGSTTVKIAEGAYIKTHQVYIGENDSVNDHTLNVYGKLDASASIFNKAKGELNVYGEVNVADQKYLQAAGDVTVSGATAALNVGGASNYGIKIGTDENGLRSKFTIENGASVNVGTIVNVGYSDTRNGDLIIDGGNFSAASVNVQNGSTFTVSGDSELNIGSLTGIVKVDSDTTLTDSNIGGGDIYVGYTGYSANPLALTIDGTKSDLGGTIWVGTDTAGDVKHSLKLEADDLKVGSLYTRANSEVNITSEKFEVSYIGQKGTMTIDGTDMTIREWLIGNKYTSDMASVTVKDSVITQKDNGGITVGYQAAANFSMTNSTLNMTYSGLTITADSSFEMVGSILSTTSLTNNGTFTVAGESTLNVNNLIGSGKLVLGAADKATDISGTANVAVATEIASGAEVTLSGNYTSSTMLVGAPKYANDGVEGFDLTIAENANAEFSAMYVSGTSKLNVDGTLDAGGTLNVYGADFAVSNKGTITAETANITGNAEIQGDANFTFLIVGQAMDSAKYQSGKVVFDGGNWESSLGNIYVGEAYVKDDADDPRKFAAMTADGNANAALVLKNGASIILKENSELRGVVDVKQNGLVELSGNSTLSVQNIKNAGNINVADSTFEVSGTLTNNGTFTVSGESSLDIDTFVNNSDKASYVQVADGTTLVDSNIGGGVHLNGDLTVDGDLTVKELRGGYLSDEKIVSEINGDKITVNTFANLKNGDYEINADMEIDQNIYLGQDGGSATISSTLTANNSTRADAAYFVFGNVTLNDGGSMNSDSSIKIADKDITITVNAGAEIDVASIYTHNGNGTLEINGGDVNLSYRLFGDIDVVITDGTLKTSYIASELVNDKGSALEDITLTVTAKKLASINGTYTIIEQTETNAYAPKYNDLSVTVDGTVRNIGDQWEFDGVTYTITNGDGNDIAIEAVANVLTVDSDITANGFSKFNTFRDAVAAANANGGAIINLTDEAYVYADALPDSAANNLLITEAGNYTITGGNGLLVNYELEVNPDKADGNYIINFDDANVTMTKLTLRDSVTATITDSVMNFKGYLGNGTASGPSYLSVYRDSALEINNSTVGLDISRGDGKFDDPADDVAGDGTYNNFGATWNIYGSLSVTDSTIYAGPGWGSDSFQIRKGASAALTGSTAHVIHLDVGYSGAEDGKLNADRTSDNASLVLDNTKVYNTMYAGDQSSILTGLLVGSSGTTNADSAVIKNNSVVDMTVNTNVYDNRDKGLYVGNKNSSVSVESGSQLIVSKAENNGTVSVDKSTLQIDGTLTNKGTINVSGSTFVAGTFDHQSTTHAVFNDVDMDVTNFKNGAASSDAYAVVGGTSKVQIDNLSGTKALRLAEGTVIKGGSSVKGGGYSVRAQGSITIGETASDVVHFDNFDNSEKDVDNEIYGYWVKDVDITVNGTLNIAESGKEFNDSKQCYRFAILGGGNGKLTTLTGAGTININTTTFFEVGDTVIDKDLTVNINTANNAHLRFSNVNLTIKGSFTKAAATGDDFNAITSGTVTVTGENASLSLAQNFYIGYTTHNFNTNTSYKSTLNVKDGATFKVTNNVRLNQKSEINVDNATVQIGDLQNNQGYINVSGESTVYVDKLTVKQNTMLTEGLMYVAEGAVLKNSKYLGAISAKGDFTVADSTLGNVRAYYDDPYTGSVAYNVNFEGTVTVEGFSGDKLVVNSGVNLTVNSSLSIGELELHLGGSLTFGENIEASIWDTITVVGELIPANAEYMLITDGWDNLSYGDYNWGKWTNQIINYNDDQYTVVRGDDAATLAGLTGINFVTIGGNLYVKDFGAATSGIYIGDLSGAVNGKVTTADGATYTVGVDAFATAADAAGEVDVDEVESITLGKGDHVNEVADKFGHISEITIHEGIEIDDDKAAAFSNDLVINNDGHLNSRITVGGDLTFTNTAKDTLVGSYTAENITGINIGAMAGSYTAANDIIIDNNAGSIGGDKGETIFNAAVVEVSGGDASDVTVNAGHLVLTDTNTFGLKTESSIITTDIWNMPGAITLYGSANMSIDGDLTNASAVFIQGDVDHTGTLTLNGVQDFTSTIGAANIVIAGGKVTLADADFATLTIGANATLNVDPDSMNSFTDAGAIKGAGTLNTTNTSDWIINDSVNRDLSDFTGSVTMGGAGIVMGKGDAPTVDVANKKKSYFADGVTMTATTNQNIYLAGGGVDTGIVFKGEGILNVGDYEDGFAGNSNDFEQTLSGDNTGFTGTVNVSEGAKLTVTNALGADAINMDYNSNESATGNTDDTQLNLNKDGLVIGGTITGDANDIINVQGSATLTADNSVFKGIVNITGDKALSIEGHLGANTVKFGTGSDLNVNNTATIDAALSGDNTAELNIATDKTATLSKENALAGFSGDAELTGTATLTLEKANETAATFSGSGTIDADGALTLKTKDALKNFSGTVDMAANTLKLEKANTTAATFEGSGIIDADGNLILKKENALEDFSGKVELGGNELTLEKANETEATFEGSGIIDADGNLILKKENALKDFSGKVELGGNTLTLKANETEATFTESGTIDADGALTLKKENALKDFSGTVELEGNKLTLEKANTTAATITGSGTIDADANQTFSGDVTGFTGTFDIAADKTVTLSGTFADADNSVINAKGGTLTLGATSTTEATVNAGTGLANLNIGGNTVTLGTGTFTNTNVAGTDGTVNTGTVNFSKDDTIGSIKVAAINMTSAHDITVTGEFAADINMTVTKGDNTDTGADLILNGTDVTIGKVTITIDQNTVIGNYQLIQSGAVGDLESVYIAGITGPVSINSFVDVNGQKIFFSTDSDILTMIAKAAYSNYVAINKAWDSSPVEDAYGNRRDLGFDAAISLDNAVTTVKGETDPRTTTGEGGTNAGDAKFSIGNGTYKLDQQQYLMTAENGVTQLTIEEERGATAVLSGVIKGSDGSKTTTLTIDGIRLSTPELYGGGHLILNNCDRASGNVIAGGLRDSNFNRESSLTVNGGYLVTRLLAGGSVVTDGSDITTGASKVEIKNTTDEKMTILSSIYGGSWVANGSVTQKGNSEVIIDATGNQIITLNGNIYANSGASDPSKVIVNGNSSITFKGSSEKLVFKGSVTGAENAQNNSTTEALIFSDFYGAFNGSISGFDKITISGDSSLSLGRRQTKTKETAVEFIINSETVTTDAAMYTVRDQNAWEFAQSITIDTRAAASGTYILVDNYAKGFEGFTFKLNGADYTLGTLVEGTEITVNDDQLVLTIADYRENVTITGDINSKQGTPLILNDSTVSGKISGASTIALNAAIGGTSTIGQMSSNYTGSDSLEIVSDADVTIGNTGANDSIVTGDGDDKISIGNNADVTVNGADYPTNQATINTGAGDDTVVIGDNSKVIVEKGGIGLGSGNDTMSIGKNSSVELKGRYQNINGGGSDSTFSMDKGSYVECNKLVDFNGGVELNVDSVLNNTCDGNLSGNAVTKLKADIVGVVDLVLNGTDKAGAKAVIHGIGPYSSVSGAWDFKVDHEQICNSLTNLGSGNSATEIKQINGADTTEIANDDVWAALCVKDYDLVVAWGRTSEEAGAALDAFKADSTLTLGKALVATNDDLADGFDATDTLTKKSNGTLA